MRRIIAGALLLLTLFAGCTDAGPGGRAGTRGEREAAASDWEAAASSPFTPYPETVVYTLGKMTGADNSNMPEGDTYENNVYTRFLFDLLRVQNEDVFEAMDTHYNTSVEMCIAAGTIPDVMIVGNQETLRRLVELDLIADLTQAYEACASDRIKEMYASYGDSVLESATYDGKLMALPETNIAEGPNLLWLRQDWMDALGLEPPVTLEDAEKIIRAFIDRDPGGNGAGNTVGLVCDVALTGGAGYSAEYMTDIIFACFGAYPKQWIENSKGEVVYGSVQPETKDALSKLRELYAEGILDPNFLLRSSTNIIELIVGGQCGSFFGPWWAPNNPLMEAVEKNPQARWKPYLIATSDDGSTGYHSQNVNYKYVVVRKGFEHPELVFKMASVMFDYIRFENKGAEEFASFFQDNVDPTARPLSINIDYNDALQKCYGSLCAALAGELESSELELLERSYYEACQAYLEDPEAAGSEGWAAYASRMEACALLTEGNTREIRSLFFGRTPTMNENWWKLEDMENETFLKIITGEEELSYFDEFVDQWHQDSGDAITREVRARLGR